MGTFIKNRGHILFFIIIGIFIAQEVLALELNWPNSPTGTQLADNSDLTTLIKYLYEWGVALGGLAAFVSLVIAGFQYVTSTGDAGKMGRAKDRIQSAVLGLVLLLSSYLILNVINPELTTLKMPTIPAPSSTLEEIEDPGVPNLLELFCDRVYVFSQPNYVDASLIATINRGESQNVSLSKDSGSIRFVYTEGGEEKLSPEDGYCQATVELYDSANNLMGNTYNSIPDIGSLYLERDVRRIRVK